MKTLQFNSPRTTQQLAVSARRENEGLTALHSIWDTIRRFDILLFALISCIWLSALSGSTLINSNYPYETLSSFVSREANAENHTAILTVDVPKNGYSSAMSFGSGFYGRLNYGFRRIYDLKNPPICVGGNVEYEYANDGSLNVLRPITFNQNGLSVGNTQFTLAYKGNSTSASNDSYISMGLAKRWLQRYDVDTPEKLIGKTYELDAKHTYRIRNIVSTEKGYGKYYQETGGDFILVTNTSFVENLSIQCPLMLDERHNSITLKMFDESYPFAKNTYSFFTSIGTPNEKIQTRYASLFFSNEVTTFHKWFSILFGAMAIMALVGMIIRKIIGGRFASSNWGFELTASTILVLLIHSGILAISGFFMFSSISILVLSVIYLDLLVIFFIIRSLTYYN